jgi:hypothetical protein
MASCSERGVRVFFLFFHLFLIASAFVAALSSAEITTMSSMNTGKPLLIFLDTGSFKNSLEEFRDSEDDDFVRQSITTCPLQAL